MTLDSLPDLDTSGLCLVKTLSTALRCWPYRNTALRDGARTSTHNSSVAKRRTASIVPKEGIALFGNPAQPVFARRGLDRRGQPDVTHHVLARGEADHRPQHE